jgi:hypothetical protein
MFFRFNSYFIKNELTEGNFYMPEKQENKAFIILAFFPVVASSTNLSTSIRRQR